MHAKCGMKGQGGRELSRLAGMYMQLGGDLLDELVENLVVKNDGIRRLLGRFVAIIAIVRVTATAIGSSTLRLTVLK